MCCFGKFKKFTACTDSIDDSKNVTYLTDVMLNVGLLDLALAR
jgi:hypothetical protein